jgi:hypothetical protein
MITIVRLWKNILFNPKIQKILRIFPEGRPAFTLFLSAIFIFLFPISTQSKDFNHRILKLFPEDRVTLETISHFFQWLTDRKHTIWPNFPWWEQQILLNRWGKYGCLFTPTTISPLIANGQEFTFSSKDGFGCFPGGLNTMDLISIIEFNGRKTFLFNLPQTSFQGQTKKDSLNPNLLTTITVFHEMFHTLQAQSPIYSFTGNHSRKYSEFLDAKNVGLILTEVETLRNFLTGKLSPQRAFKRVVSIRELREREFPLSLEWDNSIEALEGTAVYFERELLRNIMPEMLPNHLNWRLNNIGKDFYSLTRGRSYFSGMAIIELLLSLNGKIDKDIFKTSPYEKLRKIKTFLPSELSKEEGRIMNSKDFRTSVIKSRELLKDQELALQESRNLTDQRVIKLVLPYPSSYDVENRKIMPGNNWIGNYSFAMEDAEANLQWSLESKGFIGMDFLEVFFQVLPPDFELTIDDQPRPSYVITKGDLSFQKSLIISSKKFGFKIQGQGQILGGEKGLLFFIPKKDSFFYLSQKRFLDLSLDNKLMKVLKEKAF